MSSRAYRIRFRSAGSILNLPDGSQIEATRELFAAVLPAILGIGTTGLQRIEQIRGSTNAAVPGPPIAGIPSGRTLARWYLRFEKRPAK